MNDKLQSIIRYLIRHYPNKNVLTKTRITKLVYLVDWKNINLYNTQITNIKWYFDHYGPYVHDVLDVARKDANLSVTPSISNFGTIKYVLTAKNNVESLVYSDLSDRDILVIDSVIKETKDLTWSQFIDYIYSTEPIRRGNKYSYLDLMQYV